MKIEKHKRDNFEIRQKDDTFEIYYIGEGEHTLCNYDGYCSWYNTYEEAEKDIIENLIYY